MSRYKVALTVQDNAPSFYGVYDMANKSQGFNGMLLSRHEHELAAKLAAQSREDVTLREEGIAAYHAGKHIQTCPHKYMNRLQWESGFLAAKETAERNHAALCEDYFP